MTLGRYGSAIDCFTLTLDYRLLQTGFNGSFPSGTMLSACSSDANSKQTVAVSGEWIEPQRLQLHLVNELNV